MAIPPPGQPQGPTASQPGGAPEPEHRFGASPPLSIGVEEELLLVDGQRRLVPAAERVMRTLSADVRGGVSTEIFATQIELKTGICHDAAQALEELARLRRAVCGSGVQIIGSGLHPDDDGEPDLVAKPRYDLVKEDLAGLLSTPPSGLHVHVGMPDPETAIQVANALRHHLPLLQALTANSPFREGADSGLASARAAVVRSYPRFEMPREFRDYEEFRRVADQLIVAAGVPDYTYLWWDVRPHPNLGTVEVRGMDVQTDVATNVAVAALVQALAAKECDRPSAPGLAREAIEESSFQANRHGLEARLMVADDNTAPAREVARRELELAAPYANELGGGEALEEIERILREGNGADDQRRVHQRSGMDGLLAYLADHTGFAARRDRR
ncbi:MAG: glutamate---cysteine ligase / carboxylate-amine ligase [Solirubrobacterales bacterium]|jgi:carboxylate-amine ligase|nr:glutamate---cysteine ligase / carboxylate-amine ligase [Solirubrobacterales bacterium]